MPKNAVITLDQAPEILFGDSIPLVDWQYGAASMLPMLHFDLESSWTRRFMAERLARLRGVILDQFEAVASQSAEKPTAFRGELDRIRHGISSVQEAGKIANPESLAKLGPDKTLRDALIDALDRHSAEQEVEKKRYDAILRAEAYTFEPAARGKLLGADDMLQEACREDHTERTMLLRNARKTYQEVVSEQAAAAAPVLWTRYAWLCFRLSTNLDEALAIMESATGSRLMSMKPGYDLAARFYAYLLARKGNYEEAYQWANHACELHATLGACHERASYAAATMRADWARPSIEMLVHRGPLGVLAGFSDPHIGAGFGAHLLDVSVKEQMRWRQEARKQVAAWQALATKVLRARKLVGELPLPRDLLEAVETLKDEVVSVDFMSAWELIRRASAARQDLEAMAKNALNSEQRRKSECVKTARSAMEAAWQKREAIIDSALRVQQETVREARTNIVEAHGVEAKARNGCAWGLGSGCCVFSLYIFIGGFLTMKGVAVGMNTVLGQAFVGLAALPIIISLGLQIKFAYQRMVLEEKLQAEVITATRSYEQVAWAAEQQYKAEVESLREKLQKEEDGLTKVEEAIRLVA